MQETDYSFRYMCIYDTYGWHRSQQKSKTVINVTKQKVVHDSINWDTEIWSLNEEILPSLIID